MLSIGRTVMPGVRMSTSRIERPSCRRAARLVVRPHLLAQDRLLPDARLLTPPLARPAHGEPAARRELAAEGARERDRTRVVDEHAAPPVGQLLGQERAQLGPEALLLVGEGEVHRYGTVGTMPPSTVNVLPVIQLARGEARKT